MRGRSIDRKWMLGEGVIVTNMFGFKLKRLGRFNTNNILKFDHLHNSWAFGHFIGSLGTCLEICATFEIICATISRKLGTFSGICMHYFKVGSHFRSLCTIVWALKTTFFEACSESLETSLEVWAPVKIFCHLLMFVHLGTFWEVCALFITSYNMIVNFFFKKLHFWSYLCPLRICALFWAHL